jgi:lysophospholipase L1-like esterase
VESKLKKQKKNKNKNKNKNYHIFFTEHPNMLVNGIPNKDLLQPDGIHLNGKGKL